MFKILPNMSEVSTTVCPSCNGSGEGRYDGTRCQSCNGSGAVADEDIESGDADPDGEADIPHPLSPEE